MSMEELVEELIDHVDENLEASDEVRIPTQWQEQETHKVITVRAEEEEEVMVDLGPIDFGEGRLREEVETMENTGIGTREEVEDDGDTAVIMEENEAMNIL